MSTPHHLAECLTDIISQPLPKLKPIHFKLSHTESIAIGSTFIPEISHQTTLILHWEDGTVSQHHLALEEINCQHLPLKTWRVSRYFAKKIPDPVQLPSNNCHYDQKIASIIHSRQVPAWMKNFHYQLFHEKHVIFQSSGTETQKESTRIKLQIPEYWMDYQSNYMPDDSELSYLELESLWLQKIHARQLPCKHPSSTIMWVLLSPDAFTTIHSHGTIHAKKWSELKKRENAWLFQEWMKQSGEILYIPRVQILQAADTRPYLFTCAPEAYVYSEGLPKAKITLLFHFLLSEFFSCQNEAHLIKKVGWTDYGLAVPMRFLEVTS